MIWMRPVSGTGWYCCGFPTPADEITVNTEKRVESFSCFYLWEQATARFTFGMFPHDFWRWITLHRAIQNAGFSINAVLVVGLNHKTWRHWKPDRKRKVGETIAPPSVSFLCMFEATHASLSASPVTISCLSQLTVAAALLAMQV